MTILSVEIHVPTRGALKPDPAYDGIEAIFYSIQNDVPQEPRFLPQTAIGIIALQNAKYHRPSYERIGRGTQTTYVNDENELLLELVELVKKWDPDIFAGYEIEMASWGYIIQRAQVIGLNLMPQLSRVPTQKPEKIRIGEENEQQHQQQDDAMEMLEYDTHIKLHGRILLDVWRLLRSEIALTSYSFENIMYHVMHRRCPLKTFKDLTQIWTKPITRWIVLAYWLERAHGTLEILNQLDLIGRTCELAKLFGIQFYEVLSRGSQFRVESMMLR